MSDIAAIIIAAGSSSRLGEPKQLLVLQGEALLERAIRVAKEAGTEPVVVVLGAHRERIEAGVDLSGVTVVVNDDWEEGMASSIRAGVRAIKEQHSSSSGALLMVCDQPAVNSEHLGQMMGAFRRNPAGVIASVYAGKRGIPAIFPAVAYADLLDLRGDRGARELLSEEGRFVIEVPLEGGELDIDLPEDLAHLPEA